MQIGGKFNPQAPETMAAVAAELWAATAVLLQPLQPGGAPLPEPAYLQVQRWGSAYYEPQADAADAADGAAGGGGCEVDAGVRLVGCGDWAGGVAGVGGALRSGKSAAAAVERLLAAL